MKPIAAAFASAVLLLSAGPAPARPSIHDLTAIALVEARVGPEASAKPLAARMAELKVPGVSVAFIEDGRVRWTRTYGVATLGGGAVTPDTLFQAASMSKAVAAAAGLKLVEQGKLALDEDINVRMTAWKVPDSPYTATEKVTLRRLLSHTAGLTVGGFPGYVAGKPVPATVQILNGEPPANTPAVRSWEVPGKYAYSGGGYTAAQVAIAEAGLRPFPRLLEDLVLRPAGMRASTFTQPLPGAQVRRAASGHRRGEVIPGARNAYPEYAAAGLWTTPSDYARFLISIQDAQAGRPRALLTKSSAEAMLTPVDPTVAYGLGWQLGRMGGRPFFRHGGSNEGFQCASFAFLDGSRQGVVIMTNANEGGRLAGEIFDAIAKAYGWGTRFEPLGTAGPSNRRAPFSPPATAAR